MRGGGGGIRGGAVFQVWLISRAPAPCSITVNVCVKLLEVINDASSCEAGVDEVRDEEFLGVSDDIQDAMSNGSSDGDGDNGMEVEGGVITTSQAVLEHLLCFDGFQDDVKVEGKGGVVVTEVDEVEDVVFEGDVQ